MLIGPYRAPSSSQPVSRAVSAASVSPVRAAGPTYQGITLPAANYDDPKELHEVAAS